MGRRAEIPVWQLVQPVRLECIVAAQRAQMHENGRLTAS